MDALLTSDNLIALVTLTALEVVLGVDNVIFISILAGKLPRPSSRRGPAASDWRRRWSCASCCCSRWPGSSG